MLTLTVETKKPATNTHALAKQSVKITDLMI